jgi:DNA-binding XRE family transcriptional regulator
MSRHAICLIPCASLKTDERGRIMFDKSQAPTGQPAFGYWFKEQRQQAGFTRKHVAEFCGIQELSLRKIEEGRHGMEPSTRDALIAALATLIALSDSQS